MSFERLESMNGMVVVITGGAGQVGYATATRLAQQSARVIILVRSNLSGAIDKISKLPNQHLNHFAILADITDTNSLKNAVNEIRIKAGRCDVLVNAAGTTHKIKTENFSDITDDIFDSIVVNNLRGTFATIREFHNLIGEGLIVNISSSAGLRASQSNPAYGAAKAGVDLLTKTLAKQLAPKIRVVAIAPGYLYYATSGIVKASGVSEKQGQSIPLKRVGAGDDIACTIESLAMNMRYVTGITISVDGGTLL
jgi:NAD(P)-dependent dehydrogenase (short-subunit alcohol dehydrogenase family)